MSSIVCAITVLILLLVPLAKPNFYVSNHTKLRNFMTEKILTVKKKRCGYTLCNTCLLTKGFVLIMIIDGS